MNFSFRKQQILNVKDVKPAQYKKSVTLCTHQQKYRDLVIMFKCFRMRS
jgi:hypothetical protein